MNQSTSIYFDMVRVAAALCVVLGHLSQITASFLWHFGGLGHEAVIVFFVLSGFVIAYTAETKDRNLPTYAVNRLARLYSVLLPCLIVTPLFDMAGQSFATDHHDTGNDSTSLLKTALQSALFLNQAWFAHVQYFSNGPLWSLSYEFWYYVIFGAAFFLTGKTRPVLVLVACLIAGPKILVLMPIWLMGVAAYHYCRRKIDPREGALWLLLSIAGFALFFKGGLGDRLNDLSQSIAAGNKPIFGEFSDQFLADTVLGLMLTANFIGISSLASRFSLKPIAPAVRAASSFTLSIYLFHAPLLYMFNTMAPMGARSDVRALFIFLTTIACCCVLGYFSEHRKRAYVRMLKKLGLTIGAFKTGMAQ